MTPRYSKQASPLHVSACRDSSCKAAGTRNGTGLDPATCSRSQFGARKAVGGDLWRGRTCITSNQNLAEPLLSSLWEACPSTVRGARPTAVCSMPQYHVWHPQTLCVQHAPVPCPGCVCIAPQRCVCRTLLCASHPSAVRTSCPGAVCASTVHWLVRTAHRSVHTSRPL